MTDWAKKKQTLRHQYKKISTSPSERQRLSGNLCERIIAQPQFQSATKVGIFAPRAHEVDLTPLLELIPLKSYSFPKVDSTGSQMEFYSVKAVTELSSGYHGVLEPVTSQTLPTIWNAGDLIIVPGLAFDGWGGRLGSGLGFYDRYLSGLATDVIFWGVCFESHFAKAERLPMSPQDVRMSAVFTPERAAFVKP